MAISVSVDSKTAAAKKGAIEAATQAVLKSAIKVRGQAVALAPVDTGQLRSSIGYATVGVSKGKSELPTPRSDKFTVIGYVGTDVFYGHYVEFGTRYQAAQPFLRPARLILSNDKNEVAEAAREAMGRKLRRVGSGGKA